MSCKVVSFMNMKGGVGKTTVCVNLAHCLAKYKNKRVLVIDLDPQSNTSQYMLGKEKYLDVLNNDKTIFEIYKVLFNSQDYSAVELDETEEETIIEKNIIVEIEDKLSLVPGNLSMVRISQGVNSSVIMNLSSFINRNQLLEEYDFIFIDCPPTQSIYTDSALNVSDFYILPVKPDFLSSIGIGLVKNIIRQCQKTTGRKVKCAGIIFNMVHNQDYERDTMELIKQNNINDIYEECIKYSTKIAEGAEKQKYLLNINKHKGKIKKIADIFLKKVGGEN